MAAVSHHAMRRHPGGPLDPSTSIGSSYYALAHQQALPNDKSKKSWSQRLKLSKTEKLQTYNESELNAPSALSRSMKYAEPWLYGTIRGIPAPPAYRQQIYTQMPTEVAVVVCSCPEYLNGTKRDMKKATICKKCRGSRLPLASFGGTVRIHSTAPIVHASRGSAGTVRLPTYNSKQRPSILTNDNDPYDMMRRSRLVSPELQHVNNVLKTIKNRAKSSSPSRSRGRSRKRTPSPNSFNNGTRSRSASRTNQNGWLNDNENDSPGRRSILNCDLNAYEMISKISHNNEFSPMCDDDDVYNMHSKKYENILNSSYQKGNNLSVTTVAGQSIRLTSRRNSGMPADADKFIYEKINLFDNYLNNNKNGVNDNINKSVKNNNIDSNLPARPPRRKQDNTNFNENESAENPPKNEFILTTASLSHISTDMSTNLQINVIKSILKRPPSISSESETEHVNNIKAKPISISYIKKLPNTAADDNKNTDSTVSILLAKNLNTNNQFSNNFIKEKEKRNSGSHFYLPMPQRKKVQFLVENEIIQQDVITTDDSNTKLQHHDVINHGENSNDQSNTHDHWHDGSDNINRVIINGNIIGSTDTVKNTNGIVNGLGLDRPLSTYSAADETAFSSCDSSIVEDNNLPLRKNINIRRTHSDRRLSEPTVPINNVSFIDTTALRNKPIRNDSRYIFTDTTPIRPRPTEPPPPPPSAPTVKKRTPARPPRHLARRLSIQDLKNEINSTNHVDVILSDNQNNDYEKYSFKPVNNNKLNININNSKDLDVKNNRTIYSRDDDNNEQRKRIQANIEAFQGSRLFGQSNPNTKTVVKIAPLTINRESSAIHRLEVKNDDNDKVNESSKKTSILINGDDCYSTINVNDDTPIYQSSVVVNGANVSPSIFKVNSNTVSISVTTPQTPEEQKILQNNQINTILNSNCIRSIVPITDHSAKYRVSEQLLTSPCQARTLITLDYNGEVTDETDKNVSNNIIETDPELMLLLRNPVEAVKRNLVPHVCGKNHIDINPKYPKQTETLPEKPKENKHIAEKLLQTENSSFIAKLLEDPTLGHLAEGLDNELIAKLIENSLIRLKESRNNLDMSGTKDEKDMNKLIENSLQKVKEERHKLESNKVEQEKLDDHEKHSLSSGNSYSSANYEQFDFENNDLSDCYQSCSSELTTDEDGNMTRSKFYQMLVDATLSEIEISTNTDDDHHYESIRLNGDPIYEEISDVPPPLPLCPPPNDPELDKKNSKSMFEGASKYDILSYLVDAKERGIVPGDSYTYNFSNTTDIIIEEESDKVTERIHNRQSSDISSRISQLSNVSDTSEESSLKLCIQRKTAADIERNDSGVGSETSKTSRSKYQALPCSILNKNSPIHLCEDCDGPVETQVTDSGVMFAPLVCRKCSKKRAERKEIVTEIVETEEKYGRDLQIILEEFYQPMLVAGLLTQEQLSAIFLNSEELLENSQSLAEKMRDAFDIAMEQGDDDLLTVNIGKLMLEAAPMLHAFESYCVRQAAASLLLANMEKEKELLRIFLRVSQMENTVLRRMNLNSFLMVPVQRVTKYPLLLARLYKVTPSHLEGRDLLKQSQEKIELHLNHMNREAKDVPTKLWRRISSSSPNRRSSCEIDMINIKLRKMAIDLLEWHHDEVRFAIEGKLLFTQPTDNNWRKGRTIKLTPVNALLVTNGKPTSTYKVDKSNSEQLNFPRHTGIREASLLLVREKSGRYTLLREPLYLDRCIVCTESDWEDYFEVQEISSKDTFIFKAEDGSRTKQWYTQLQYHAQGMGPWRKRRNALANIMINGMMMRS